MIFEKEPDELIKEIIKKTCSIALILIIPSLIVGKFSNVIGIIYGLVISILLFRLKYIHINKALDMSQERATRFIRNRYFVNYGVYFIVLLTAYLSPNLNFLAVVISLLLLKFVIIGLAVIEVIKERWSKKMKSFQEGRF